MTFSETSKVDHSRSKVEARKETGETMGIESLEKQSTNESKKVDRSLEGELLANSHLVRILRKNLHRRAERAVFRFLIDGENEDSVLRGTQLDDKARAIAARLERESARRALLIYPPGLEFIEAFLGCLYAGVIAVPAYPPNSKRALPRLASIVDNARPDVVLTRASHVDRFRKISADLDSLSDALWLTTDEIAVDEAADWREPELGLDTVAFLQYTSGSTADPKGVVVEHRHLIHNQEMIRQAFQQDENSVVVSWLPVYHDMGLIGAVLQPLWSGGEAILMSPVSFLQKPIRWLQAISRYGATTSGAPNFAFDLCVDRSRVDRSRVDRSRVDRSRVDRSRVDHIRPEPCKDLDLSRWTVAFNGAEPVRAKTLQRFSAAFAEHGFRSEAFFPCYGLAEATLFVSGGTVETAPIQRSFSARALEAGRATTVDGEEAARDLVSCGQLLGDQELVIVNPKTRQQSREGEVGEIWLAGDSVAAGYEGQESLSEAIFAARFDGSSSPFLRTGDLGFVQDGELFITGRLKDLIIVRGRNHHPEDLEQTVSTCHAAFTPASCAAFTTEDDEKLVIVQELERTAIEQSAEIAEAIRQEVSARHELSADEVVFIRTATLPKTPSGKVQRQRCRQLLADEKLNILARHTLVRGQKDEENSTALEAVDLDAIASLPEDQKRVVIEGDLRAVLSLLLRLDPHTLPSDRPLASLGLDSLEAIQLQETLQRRFGIAVQLDEILDDLTLEQLTERVLLQIEGNSSPTVDSLAELDSVLEAVLDSEEDAARLSFEQERLWWLSQIQPDNAAFNIPIALRLDGEIDLDRLEVALAEISRRHDALRSRFVTVAGEPTLNHDADVLKLEKRDLATELPVTTLAERARKAETILAENLAQPFDLTIGPPVRALWIGLDDQSSLLLVVAHHLVFDLWSGRLLVKELAELYEQNLDATGSESPLRYSNFAAWQRRNLAAGHWEPSLAFWRQRLEALPTLELPSDRPRPQTRERSENSSEGQSLTFEIPAETARTLAQLGQEHGATLFHGLTAVFDILLAKLCDQNEIAFATPVAGRPLAATRRAIGFFAYPMILATDLSGCESFAQVLERVKQSALEAYAHQQVPFSKVVEAVRDRTRLRSRMLFGLLDEQGTVALPQRLGNAAMEPLEIAQQATDFEQAWTLFRDGAEGSLRGRVVYQSELFDAATLEATVRSYLDLMDAVLADPERPLADLVLDARLAEQAERARQRDLPQSFVVSATFTADPLADSLAFWGDQLGIKTDVALAPYNQTLQQLLSPTSELNQNPRGCNVVLLRLEDVWRFGGQQDATPSARLNRFIDDFLPALKGATERRKTPFFLVLCPSSPQAEESHSDILSVATARIKAAANELPSLTLIHWTDVQQFYPLDNPHDAYGDDLGHLPYTETFFSALGTYLARRWHSLKRKPFKVIALDCDQTLWRGVCAEDGVDGISLEAPFADLQRFMIEQQQAGKVLVLVSKNEEADVLAVFDQRDVLPLKREHLATWRINWQAKSKNLEELAEELQLGLDSFLFLDDNPIECAEVEGRLPEVLTLRRPADLDRTMPFLRHCWAFDAWGQTREDQERTRFYQQNAERETQRRDSADLQTFIDSLELEVNLETMQADQIARVSQLTQRTNQFNCSRIRRSEAEIAASAAEIRTVSVRDRFGDYGLVGTLMFRPEGSTLVVDTFLLSCRALGRGVEHQMLANLGQTAIAQGLETVAIPYRPTPRNRPAFDFLASIVPEEGAFERTKEHVFRLAADRAAECRYRPAETASTADVQADDLQLARPTAPRELARIAQEFQNLDAIHQAIRHFRTTRKQARTAAQMGAKTEYVAPRNALETEVAALWADLLGSEKVGIETSFFALGGDSLIAVQLLSRVREQFQVELTMRDALDEDVTIASLAQAIERAQIDQASDDDIDDILAELEGLSEEEIQLLLAEEEVG